MRTSRFFLLAGLLAFYACKKNSEEVQAVNASTAGMAEKVTAWLESQKFATNPERNQKIEELKSGLVTSGLRIEKRNEKERLIIVPFSKEFKTEYNSQNKPLMHLVAALGADGKITGGNIIQYVPKSGQATALPENTFSKIYTHQNTGCDGKFSTLSLTGVYRFSLVFEGGRLSMVQEPLKKEKDGSTQRTSDKCWSRYLVTTYYDEDGNTVGTTETFLGTLCYPCGVIGPDGNTIQCTEIDNGTGAPEGGGNIVYEYAVTNPVSWIPFGSTNGYNIVYSNEYLNGTRAPGGASKFSSITHDKDRVSNGVGIMDYRYAEWHRDAWDATLSSDYKQGTTKISGMLTYPFSSSPNYCC